VAISAVIWRDETKDNDRFTYKMQISDVPKRSMKKILRETEEWQRTGDGVNFRKEKLIFLFRREFNSQEEVLEWAQNFSYPVKRINRAGKEVVLKKKGKNGSTRKAKIKSK